MRVLRCRLGEVPLELGDGAKPRSAKVAVNAAYIESDLKITTALIEPHLMAGYSGGRKLVCPGIASAETIMQFPFAADDRPQKSLRRQPAG